MAEKQISFIRALEGIVSRYSDTSAVIDRGLSCSYQQLWDEAAQVAGFLKSKGIGREDIVGINLPKSKDYIVSLLGTWMAGAAFMPLDPSLPQERLDFIIAEAEPKYIISGQTLSFDLYPLCPRQREREGHNRKVGRERDCPELNSVRDNPSPQPSPTIVGRGSQESELHPEDLAYVIYTSGSTARPKGVMICHRGLVPMLQKQISVFELAPGKKSLFYLSIAFDASVSDMGACLLSGATLVIEDDQKLKDGAALIEILHDKEITHFDCPPSLLQVLARQDMPQCLETIIIGGEICPPETIRKWAENFRIVNVYGPTEATVCSSLCLCDAQEWQQPLIGQRVPGTYFRVLDGELYIAGDGLARGYLKQPALTAEKFLTLENKRFYKTGDMVRVLPDNEILFLGRADRQFKLRGQLIAPEEIETQILQCKGVTQAAVVKRPLASGMRGESLVAFISPKDVSIKEISLFLEKTLPRWMVPDHFETVGSFIKTASGKPDYNVLKTMPLNFIRPVSALGTVTPTEKKLLQSWRKVLDHDQFGPDDSFFRIGGDSLGVIRLTLEAERSGIKLSPGLIALNPTVRSLARAVDKDSQGNSNAASSHDLRKEALLDAEFQGLLQKAQTRSIELPADNKNFLLTGATGSLGSRLLPELLDRTPGTVYCLIRARDAAQARARLIEKTGLDDERLIALAGDIGEKHLGLSPETWDFLSREIDAIYHCAAVVNMIAPYKDLKASNVDGVKGVLRFALTGRRKHLHYASTLSVFVATDQNAGAVYENDKLEKTTKVYGGYAQSKWVAECLLHQIPEQAAPISQYRFGLITGDSRTGTGSSADFLSLFVRGIKALGVVPPHDKLQRLAVDITPVDCAVAAMADISLCVPGGGVYHVANARSLILPEFLSSLERCGVRLSEVTADEWRALPSMRRFLEEESAAWTSLCRVLPESDFERLRTMDLFQSTDIIFDMSHSKFACLPPGRELIDKYVRHILSHHSGMRRVCLFGPESTGKSTLAKKLAEHFNTVYVPEFAKEVIEARGGVITLEDIPAIAAGQAASEDRTACDAHGVLVCDTDLLTTQIWSEWLFGECPRWIKTEAMARSYDLYLLMDIDVPWVDDIHRYEPQKRQDFMEVCEKELRRRRVRYIKISGDWQSRFLQSVEAITALTQNKESSP